jgi:hypothetical protein
MDTTASYRKARRIRRGWLWVCYEHSKPVRRFYPNCSLGLLLRRWQGYTAVAEWECRQDLRKHLRTHHGWTD